MPETMLPDPLDTCLADAQAALTQAEAVEAKLRAYLTKAEARTAAACREFWRVRGDVAVRDAKAAAVAAQVTAAKAAYEAADERDRKSRADTATYLRNQDLADAARAESLAPLAPLAPLPAVSEARWEADLKARHARAKAGQLRAERIIAKAKADSARNPKDYPDALVVAQIRAERIIAKAKAKADSARNPLKTNKL